MSSALRQRPSTFSPSDGSRTITLLDSQPREEGEAGSSGGDTHEGLPDGYVGTLNLRGGPRSRPRVAWTADVVDNEGMGKKKSKICCIYHKPKRFDESSDESSDSDSSDASDDSRGHAHHHHHHHHHRHVHGDGDGERAMRTRSGDSSGVEEIQDEPKNAYERQQSIKGKQKA